ncbi:hypothetical protein [Kushneria indalinina]|uniref:Uncharacterized protein n=1 Tax=Kushneria indalinina DSM 14324 TaxID=1122140 RepID=A0A3D9DVU5_9GAMM|nr:hypothetical protein [Kushneria indalinina]REC94900.1 hypothetical protein C8D72_1729 [Kushneria indalinina DSM 14324]
MSESKAPARLKRVPNGCNAKPIWLQLKKDERDSLEVIAGEEMRSLSAQARMFCLKGMEAYRAESESNPTPVSH